MEIVYLVMFIFGTGFFIISFIMGEIFGAVESAGEHIGDFVHDAFHIGGDHDVVGDHHDGGHDRVNPLSIRNIFAAMGAFGGVGEITSIIQLPVYVSIGLSLAAGGIAFIAAWQLYVFLVRQGGTSHATDQDFLNQEARVEIPIPKGGVGQVRLIVKGQNLTMAASSDNETTIPAGTKVLVREKKGGTVIVTTIQ